MGTFCIFTDKTKRYDTVQQYVKATMKHANTVRIGEIGVYHLLTMVKSLHHAAFCGSLLMHIFFHKIVLYK